MDPDLKVIGSRTDWREHAVLVTGCSGFVGGWLLSRLVASGARVIGFGRNSARAAETLSYLGPRAQITFVQGSLTGTKSLEQGIQEYSVDTIFHLAAQSKVDLARRNPTQTFETNLQGTWNVLEAARKVGRKIRVILASTEMVYGDSLAVPYTEDAPADNLSPYAASKICAEVLAKSYHRTYGIPVCIARTSNLYGGGDWGFERIIPGTIRAVMRGEAPVIKSDAARRRDYLYIEDAISGYMVMAEAMEREEVTGDTFNLSCDAPVSMATLVETILRLMERTDLRPQVLGEVASDTPVRHSSSSKARTKLGWCAETSLVAGLKKTIEWYQAHRNEVRLEAQNR